MFPSHKRIVIISFMRELSNRPGPYLVYNPPLKEDKYPCLQQGIFAAASQKHALQCATSWSLKTKRRKHCQKQCSLLRKLICLCIPYISVCLYKTNTHICNKIIELEGLVLSAKAHCVHEASAIPGDLTAHSASERKNHPLWQSQTDREKDLVTGCGWYSHLKSSEGHNCFHIFIQLSNNPRKWGKTY